MRGIAALAAGGISPGNVPAAVVGLIAITAAV